MGIHDWARHTLQAQLNQAAEQGFEPSLALRALLSAVVEASKCSREPEDLRQELLFLADNLDDERDYGFMRP